MKYEDPEIVFLEPACANYSDEGRMWCEDDVWEHCPDCSLPSVEYIRKDISKAMALDEVQKEVEGYLPEFGAGDPQDGTDLIIDQCWRDFRKIILRLKGQ